MTENRNKRWDDNRAHGQLNWTEADKVDLAEALHVRGVRTWRQRIGVSKDWPLHAPNDVERAMVAEIAELRLAAAKEPGPRTDLSKRIREAATADVTLAQARLLIGAAEEIERAQQAAEPDALLAILRDVHDTLASESDSDIDHFEDDDEEREGAPVQYAARKVMEVMDMLKAAAPSAPGTPEAPAAALHPLHPLQPLVQDAYGHVRFKRNAIVDHLATDKLNDLAAMDFPEEDWEQLAQLIGYSLHGFGTLSYVKDETYERAAAQPVVQRAAQLDGGQGEGEKA